MGGLGSERADWIVFDVESTGLRRGDRVVEFACLLLDRDGAVTDSYETVLDPRRSPGPVYVHGLTAEVLAGAPRFAAVAGDIARLFRDRVPVAHHLRFDWGLLRGEFGRLGVAVPPVPSGICTARLASVVGIGGRRADLDGVCRELGITIDDRHTAAGDARAAAEVLIALHSVLDHLPDPRACSAFPGAGLLPPPAMPVPRSALPMAAST